MRRAPRLLLGVVFVGAACRSRPTPAPASASPVARATAQSGPRDILVRETFVPKRGDAAFAAFHAAVPADEKGGECALSRTTGNGATIVTAGFPARKDAQLQVTMMFDSVGHLMRYVERRGGGKIPPPSTLAKLTDAQRDSAIRASLDAVRMTSVNLDWAIDRSLAINRGGGLPTDAIVGTVKAMESLPQLGPVNARLERVRRLCGV